MDIDTLKKTMKVGQTWQWSLSKESTRTLYYIVVRVTEIGAKLREEGKGTPPFEYEWADFNGDLKAGYTWELLTPERKVAEVDPADTIII